MKLARLFIPQIVDIMYFKAMKLIKPGLFNGDDHMFKRVVERATVYGEYGVGESTSWIYRNTSAHIIAVDSSKQWIEKVLSEIEDRSRIDVVYVDLGATGAWGRPVGYEQKDHFIDYVQAIWTKERQPDTVLIDGRFRVCTFLYSLMKAKAGANLIFDDYVNRPHYKIVEDYVRPIETCGRQAHFIVPENRDLAKIEATMQRFLYVVD